MLIGHFACVSLACGLVLMSLGGALYEFTVVDPYWPSRPDLVQPAQGGINRKRFWIPIHVAFELALIVALVVTWSRPEIRFWLLIALASHTVMRIWSAFDFIPKALAFERVDAHSISAADARRWTRRSMLRIPLDLITCGSMLMAVVSVPLLP